ncbi:MAG: hypothetical protein ACTSV7_14035 [Candidatus Baldrarchaeia archaeon]
MDWNLDWNFQTNQNKSEQKFESKQNEKKNEENEEKKQGKQSEKAEQLEKSFKRLRIFTLLVFLVFSAYIVVLMYQNQILSEELLRTKVEAAFTYNMLKYAVAVNNAKDDNEVITARQNYIENYYFLMAQIPDENISSLASQMATCYNERDALLDENKITSAFLKQKECQKIEKELEHAFYVKMQKEGFDKFIYKKENMPKEGDTYGGHAD